MTVKTTRPAIVINGMDSIATKKNKAVLTLERSKNPIVLMTVVDSLKSQIIVEAKNSMAYKLNIFNYGIGALIERKSPKRYEYPWTIKINPSDTTIGIYDYYKTTHKRQINLTYSLPWVNNFYLQPFQEPTKVNTGFWGVSAGLEYYYKDNKYLSLTGSAVMDFFIPFPAPVDFEGETEDMYSVYASLTDNHRIKRYTIGYGLNFSRNTWSLTYHGGSVPATREPATKSDNSIGIIIDGYYQVGKRFHVGLIYRPTLLNVYPDVSFKYEHLISLDFKWKIRLKQ
ncbi:hypothetical protein [Carboxylicivirga marina]|uniref:hypothetical protein n=2 Tax=Carboxylicivirga marina TaxID=2800988 RepID=UPI002597D7A4|nr:hypothetical protein [uncultured Carboxylicivirga sp.]